MPAPSLRCIKQQQCDVENLWPDRRILYDYQRLSELIVARLKPSGKHIKLTHEQKNL